MKISDEIVQEFGSLLPFKTTQGLKYSEIEKALSAVLPKLMVKVKPLEWGKTSYGTPEVYTEVGVYRINNAWSGGWSVVIKNNALRDTDGRENFATVEEAKAAAQADYERRMLQGLEIVKDDDIWKKAFAAQSRKLQSVLHINGVKEELSKLDFACDNSISGITKVVDVETVRRQALEDACKILEHEADEFGDLVDEVSYHLLRKAKIIRSLSAEPAQGEQWRDMKDAPKDGTVILAWHITHKCPVPVLWKDDGFPYQGERLNWFERTYTSSWPERSFSHWMPLPDAPTTEAGQ